MHNWSYMTVWPIMRVRTEPDRTEHDEERASDPLITVMTIIDQSVRLLGWKRREALRFARHSRAHCREYFVKKPSSRTLVLDQAKKK